MKITELYIYPIKSLRPICLPSATLCPQGLAHDRRYILLKPKPDGTYQNMFVGQHPEMALFHCSISSESTFKVTYHTPTEPVLPPTEAQSEALEIPYTPDVSSFEKLNIKMHTSSSYPAYKMPEELSAWFTSCLGYPVNLAFLGDGLGIPSTSPAASEWINTLSPVIPAAAPKLNFSDSAALLVVTERSLQAISALLEGGNAVLEKFRPNIVVDGNEDAWDEDFWTSLSIIPPSKEPLELVLTSNCARCTSINVDLERGKMGTDDSGKLLKKMMKDRRVDKGNKWEPVFGRYGFPTQGGEISVGMEVVISGRSEERSVWNGLVPRLTSFAPLST